ncbi:hypothetical protein BEWA_010740 [Theileria equi strain WA]|uniref:Uncharacterized protein n=1 Tax=Theileria equi strain WA TaxID=1537102 RepID=L0B1B1_THEEQ|nr:hypothetical protein BEWA_010740 [Theileria equi strain WA]AFZ81657.1 hypothetical protein BEWA_010740 [Theileria equi strain WA]|eukprot:XP_004831323.1 hypothetical protein BEWA_010740 [Theileria equi strain WA]
MKIYGYLFDVIALDMPFIANAISSQGSLLPFGVNVRNTIMSGIQDIADFAVNIHPPKQDVDETLRSLDGIMLMENAQHKADNEDFTEAERTLLKIHKNKIREIVEAAFEPVHAMVTFILYTRIFQFPSQSKSIITKELVD